MSHHLQMHIDSIRCDDHNIKAVMGLCISLHWSRLGGQKLTILSNVEARRPGEVVLTRMWSSLSAVLPSLLLHLHSFHPSAVILILMTFRILILACCHVVPTASLVSELFLFSL